MEAGKSRSDFAWRVGKVRVRARVRAPTAGSGQIAIKFRQGKQAFRVGA